MFPLGVLKRKTAVLQTTLELQFEGANNSTTFTDSSSFARPVSTAFGTPKISTAQSADGSSSLLLDGVSGISIPDSNSLDFGNKDFEIEFYVRPTSSPNLTYLISRWISPSGLSYQIFFSSSGKMVGSFRSVSNGYRDVQSTTTIPQNVWTKVKITKDVTNLKLYIDDVLEATTASLNATIADETAPMIIGCWPLGGSGMVGYLDKLIVKRV